MNLKEFLNWLETCPTHKWNIVDPTDQNKIRVMFPVEEDDPYYDGDHE